MMKYKIIPDDIVKNMIEFLDEIQFEAAKGDTPDDLQRINFCNYLIHIFVSFIKIFSTHLYIFLI